MNVRAAVIALCLCTTQAQSAENIPALLFSALQPGSSLPSEWRIVSSPRIPRHTRYTLVSDGSVTVLRADSQGSMSSLARKLDVDPMRYPRLRWRWKVENLVAKSDMQAKSGDDFPARIYVFFDFDIRKLSFPQQVKLRLARMLYGDEVPLASLCYVWATQDPVGASAWNAYTDRVRVVVAQSGADALGRWVEIERNVAEDYLAAFGESPPPVIGIAIATDTDNTGERAVAYYGDAEFLSAAAGR